MRRDLLIAGAVLVAGGAISAVILTAGDAPPAPGPIDVIDTAAAQARAQSDAAAALEERRAEWIERCWRPSVNKQAEPRRITLTFDLSFDAAGTLVATGVSEDRTAARPDVAQCLRSRPLALQIRPPGVPVRVEVPFELPDGT